MLDVGDETLVGELTLGDLRLGTALRLKPLPHVLHFLLKPLDGARDGALVSVLDPSHQPQRLGLRLGVLALCRRPGNRWTPVWKTPYRSQSSQALPLCR